MGKFGDMITSKLGNMFYPCKIGRATAHTANAGIAGGLGYLAFGPYGILGAVPVGLASHVTAKLGACHRLTMAILHEHKVPGSKEVTLPEEGYFKSLVQTYGDIYQGLKISDARTLVLMVDEATKLADVAEAVHEALADFRAKAKLTSAEVSKALAPVFIRPKEDRLGYAGILITG